MADPPSASDADADADRPAPEEVERRYDFEDFGPEEMRRMSPEEWDAAFDPDSWITGERLLDRVAGELRARVATRDVFAAVEEVHEGGEPRLVAYDDEGYALVYPDGTVEGVGTVLRDVKPTVALCSMETYEPSEPPEDGALLPDPGSVPEQSGEFGNLMIQVTAAVFLLAGLALVVAWPLVGLSVLAAAVGLFLLVPIGVFLFLTVANARLSDRFRAQEYRERLRAVGLEDGERPDFLPLEGDEVVRRAPEHADSGPDPSSPGVSEAPVGDEGTPPSDGSRTTSGDPDAED